MISQDLAAHIQRLRRYARALCRDAADADDLVQETLTKAIDRAALFRPGSDLRAWLFGILHNTFVSATRTAARRRQTPISDEHEAFRIEPGQEMQIELRRVLVALEQLPEEQRRVIVLVSVEGMTTDEAADVLGLPVGTVRSRLWRGREALRRISRGEAAESSTLRLVGGQDVQAG